MPSVGKDVEQLERSQASTGSMCCYNYFAEMFVNIH